MIEQEEILKRIQAWNNGKTPGPVSIHLDTTNNCNIRCAFCWMRASEREHTIDYGNELSEKRLLSLVDDAYELGAKDWLISGGGEPLLRTKTTLNVMERIKKHGMWGEIITNGQFLSKETVERIVRMKWDVLRVSLTGPNAPIHDATVGKKGAFVTAIKGLKWVTLLKNKLVQDKPEIGFNTVLTKVNHRYLPEMIELLRWLGGVKLNVQTMILYGKEEKNWALSPEEQNVLKTIIPSLKKQLKLANITSNLDDYRKNQLLELTSSQNRGHEVITRDLTGTATGFLKTFCYQPWWLVTIRANGIVGSCRMFRDEGDSLHKKTLKEIWEGQYYQKNRTTLKKGNMLSFCKTCGANELNENNLFRKELKTVMM